MTKNVKGIILALVASFCAVLMSVFLKFAQVDTNVFSVGFMRFFFGFLLIYNTDNLKFHITRSIINVPMMILGFAALMYIPLDQIKAIGFLSPILVVILSVIFLKERIYLIRTFSLILGFIFSASTIWNSDLMFLQSYAWIIGAFVSYIIYYLLLLH